MELDIKSLYKAFISVNRGKVFDIVSSKKKEGCSVVSIFDELIIPVMERIGYDWEHSGLSLSQVYMSGKLCEEIAEEILASETSVKNQKKIGICVLNDYHTLGKKIVSMLLKGSGYSVKDYGRITIPPLLEKLKRDNLTVCFISVLMLPSALSVRDLKTALADTDVTTKIVVGGAPFRLDKNLWKKVGADDFGANSGDALALAEKYTKA